jgi:peroxiredoxin
MALTESTMLELGTTAPAFSLPDVVSGKTVSLKNLSANPLLVLFICTHCPYVKHIEKGIAQLGADYAAKPLNIIAISSNDSEAYPDDSPAGLRAQATRLHFPFPYLYDESQQVAHAYLAACTPDIYLFDKELRLVYRGQFDPSRPGNGIPVTGSDLRAAIDAVLSGRPVAADQRPSIGCNIKWKP